MSIALVIPGHNCASTLDECLRAVTPLVRQGTLSEILFVSDHCTDESEQIASSFAEVRVLHSTRRGAGAARNAGWRSSSCELIWFVDADCVVEPEALERLCPHLDDPRVVAVGGSYANMCSGQLIADLIHEEMVSRHAAMGQRSSFAITANLLCRRAALEALGGFDESLRLAQDLDLAYRVVRSGAALAFEAQSRVAHCHETRALRYLYKQARQGYWRMQLYQRHPQRVAGDSYSTLLDHAQPPLALLSPFSGAATALLFALQLPRTLQLLERTHQPRYLAYAPFGMVRALFRGVGMTAGALHIALSRVGGAQRSPSTVPPAP